MPRKRKNFRRCGYQGCSAFPRSGRKRCDEHNSWKLRAAELGERPPKPSRGYEWCEPCQAWMESPLHFPISSIA